MNFCSLGPRPHALPQHQRIYCAQAAAHLGTHLSRHQALPLCPHCTQAPPLYAPTVPRLLPYMPLLYPGSSLICPHCTQASPLHAPTVPRLLPYMPPLHPGSLMCQCPHCTQAPPLCANAPTVPRLLPYAPTVPRLLPYMPPLYPGSSLICPHCTQAPPLCANAPTVPRLLPYMPPLYPGFSLTCPHCTQASPLRAPTAPRLLPYVPMPPLYPLLPYVPMPPLYPGSSLMCQCPHCTQAPPLRANAPTVPRLLPYVPMPPLYPGSSLTCQCPHCTQASPGFYALCTQCILPAFLPIVPKLLLNFSTLPKSLWLHLPVKQRTFHFLLGCIWGAGGTDIESLATASPHTGAPGPLSFALSPLSPPTDSNNPIISRWKCI